VVPEELVVPDEADVAEGGAASLERAERSEVKSHPDKIAVMAIPLKTGPKFFDRKVFICLILSQQFGSIGSLQKSGAKAGRARPCIAATLNIAELYKLS
jgi:hypothetical protein